MGFFSKVISKLTTALEKTRQVVVTGLKNLILGRKLDEQLLDEVERMLLEADVGPAGTSRLIDSARQDFRTGKLKSSEELLEHLKRGLREMLAVPGRDQPGVRGDDAIEPIALQTTAPTVILVTGINGAGKTTSIAKLASRFVQQDRKVMIAAADTFRAGAVMQLQVWVDRLNQASPRHAVELIKGSSNADPAAVAFDAAKAAAARNVDVLIVDTAGRLQTQDPLMKQLAKIRTVLGKQIPGAPHETLLVLDATSGQNALRQAEEFSKAAGVTGIVLAKLDGTAKGGVVVAIRGATSVPVKYVGTGERMEDLAIFDAESFVEAMFVG
jgi:fused signal recognition particle receptor